MNSPKRQSLRHGKPASADAKIARRSCSPAISNITMTRNARSAELQNCIVLCRACHSTITRQRAAVIAKSNRVRAKHLGLRRSERPSFATNKDGPFKKRMNGTVERR